MICTPYTNDILSLTPRLLTHPNTYESKNGLICAENDIVAWDVNFSLSTIFAVPSCPIEIPISAFVFGSLKLAPICVLMCRFSLEFSAKPFHTAARLTFALTLWISLSREEDSYAKVVKIQRRVGRHRHDGLAKLVVVAARHRVVDLVVREAVVVALR